MGQKIFRLNPDNPGQTIVLGEFLGQSPMVAQFGR
jgi:hypothetical protein